MEQKNKNVMIVSIISLALVLIGVTYAYFSARITGLESASTISLTAGRMGIHYAEGDENISASNIYPRSEAWITKTFTLTGYNTTDQEMKYEIGLNVITNTFTNGYLTYDLTLLSGSNGTPVASKTNVEINGTGKKSFGKGTFLQANGAVHSYELKIYFKDNGLDQNDAQQALFNAKIYVEEALPPTEPEGWSDAPAGTLLAGIKTNYPTATAPLTSPGQEPNTSQEVSFSATEDDYGISYYFRGKPMNNFVLFANMCWQIVRIDGLGNVKLILSQKYADDTGKCFSYDNGSAFIYEYGGDTLNGEFSFMFNNNDDKNTYIGYMYSNNPDSNVYNIAHANDNDSVILKLLKYFYDDMFTQNQKNMIADTIWCNDKRVVTDTSYDPLKFNNVLGTGLGTDKTYYQGFQRLCPEYGDPENNGFNRCIITNAAPSLKCGNSKTDNLISKFTASTDGGWGNGALNGYKIGLITTDEASFAGLTINDNLYDDNYLNFGTDDQTFIAMTPTHFSGYSAGISHITSGGIAMNWTSVSETFLIRPAIAIRGDLPLLRGNGTTEHPFVITEYDINFSGNGVQAPNLN